MKPTITAPELESSLAAFLRWLARTGGVSFDPYDLWGTRYGLWARRLYYSRNPLGTPLIAPLLLVEVLCPGLRTLLVRQQHFATADAQLALGFLNLHPLDPGAGHLGRAEALARHLLDASIPGYRGHCWGYPFDWQNNRGLWKRNTPYITATPYCFEAFLGLHDATGNPAHLEVAESAARFVHGDLRNVPYSPTADAGSYSPHDETKVVNATAYRSFVLFEAARRFGEEAYLVPARRNLNFVLESQQPDGSWLYGLHHRPDQFIDHFHTCFVLKNLVKIERLHPDERIAGAIERGYAYYRRHLFGPDDLPRMFSVQPRLQIVRLEMYNFAEAITLGVLLRDRIPEACTLACRLARRLIDAYQLPSGAFVTRVYLGGLRHTLPFLRWPQSQLFYALTNLLRALKPDPGPARALSPQESPDQEVAAR